MLSLTFQNLFERRTGRIPACEMDKIKVENAHKSFYSQIMARELT